MILVADSNIKTTPADTAAAVGGAADAGTTDGDDDDDFIFRH